MMADFTDIYIYASFNLKLIEAGWRICVSKLNVNGSDNGLSPGRCQAIIWTSAGILLIGPLGTNFSEILVAIITFSFKKMRLKVSSAKPRPFCLGFNVLSNIWTVAFQHPHYKDKTVVRPSYLCNGIPIWIKCHFYIVKIASLSR